jgi:hypothetical protein
VPIRIAPPGCRHRAAEAATGLRAKWPSGLAVTGPSGRASGDEAVVMHGRRNPGRIDAEGPEDLF